ncbi:MAG TPA: hypothetical protein PKD92_13965 [Novosphingobium sp.]|nr:hypothetical protein [Novosphingobium sp.]HMP57654.1 hypothetical protein [Novosphingobium sp.]
MELDNRRALLQCSLQRASEVLGDITPHVYAAYYARFPEARASFEQLHPGSVARLEGERVSQSLYCLMEWFDSPGEIEIVLLGTIPHHIETLGIAPQHFSELLLCTCDTLMATIPAEAGDERAVMAELRSTMAELFALGASQVQKR